jgi:YaiO family outer membrane protein
MDQSCGARAGVAMRAGVCGSLLLAIMMLVAGPAMAQGSFFAEASGTYSPVDFGTVQQTWQSSRLSGGFLDEGRAGWTVGLQREQRDRLTDWTGSASGFRRSGDWTFSGGVGLGANPTFSYRRSFEGELARRVVGSLVAHGGYRYLDFTSASIHLIQPAVTLYLPHGDIGARYFVVRNATRATTTGTLQVHASVTVNPRLRLGGGSAFGERIFDIASLQTPTANAWVGYGYAHITASPQWSFDLSIGRAHENPSFSQGVLTLGVRRTFGKRP